jgi:hypothetical protein
MDRPCIICFVSRPLYYFTYIQREAIGLSWETRELVLPPDMIAKTSPPIIHTWTVALGFMVLFLQACSVTEQTPEDVGQKFQEGLQGNGKIVPNEKDPSQTSPPNNSPVIKPTSTTQP